MQKKPKITAKSIQKCVHRFMNAFHCCVLLSLTGGDSSKTSRMKLLYLSLLFFVFHFFKTH